MYTILLLIIIFAIIAFIANQKKKSPVPEQVDTSYELINSVLTPAERSFYGVLKQVVGGETEIFTKVRVADVLKPQKGISKGAWQTAFNKISRKHFDFLLCNKTDLSFICGIELNDISHKNKNRKERDNFLLSACGSANLPLVMIDAQANYSLTEIKQTLSAYIPVLSNEPTTEITTPPLSTNEITQPLEKTGVEQEAKVCPKCSSILVKRVAKKGIHAGKEFLACNAYPKCKYIEQMPNNPINPTE